MPRDFFLSYSRKEAAMANALAGDLEELGHAVWFDQHLSGGQAWWDVILERIRNTDAFVAALSAGLLQSAACQVEWEYALALGKPILPVLLADCPATEFLPPALAATHYVDYRERTRASALHLVRALNALPPARELPTPVPKSPPLPLSPLGGLRQRVLHDIVLSFPDQSALLLELKQQHRLGLHQDEVRDLMARFRNRSDLLATVAVELDEVLASLDNVPASRMKPLAVALSSRIRPVALSLPNSDHGAEQRRSRRREANVAPSTPSAATPARDGTPSASKQGTQSARTAGWSPRFSSSIDGQDLKADAARPPSIPEPALPTSLHTIAPPHDTSPAEAMPPAVATYTDYIRAYGWSHRFADTGAPTQGTPRGGGSTLLVVAIAFGVPLLLILMSGR